MYNRLVDLHKNPKEREIWQILGGAPAQRAVENYLPMFFATVALYYKGLNGMEETTRADVQKIFRDVLVAVMFPTLADKIVNLRNLITRYGLLVDQAIWTSTESSSESIVIYQTDGTLRLEGPKQRYLMSAAQVQLFQMRYGFQPVVPTGEGFETTVSQFCEMVLLAGRSMGSMRAILKKLGLETSELSLSAKFLDSSLDYEAVSVRASDQKIEPAAINKLLPCTDWAKSVKRCIDANHAVVLINAPKASFADVIVLIPKKCVIVVQVRFYDEKTNLSDRAMLAELWKMGMLTEETLHAYFAQTVKLRDVPRKYMEGTVDKKRFRNHLKTHDHDCKACDSNGLAKKLKQFGLVPENGGLKRSKIRRLFVEAISFEDVPEKYTNNCQVKRSSIFTHLNTHKDGCSECKKNGMQSRLKKVKRKEHGVRTLAKRLKSLTKAKEYLYSFVTTKAPIDGLAGVLQLRATGDSLYPIEMPERVKHEATWCVSTSSSVLAPDASSDSDTAQSDSSDSDSASSSSTSSDSSESDD
jgi:hypothetical protein